MINFISLIDERHCQNDISFEMAIKLRHYHDQVYGKFNCIIEIDGVEYED